MGPSPRRSALARPAFSAGSKPWSVCQSLVVTNTSSRASPLCRTASPTSASLRYIAAVSTDR